MADRCWTARVREASVTVSLPLQAEGCVWAHLNSSPRCPCQHVSCCRSSDKQSDGLHSSQFQCLPSFWLKLKGA